MPGAQPQTWLLCARVQHQTCLPCVKGTAPNLATLCQGTAPNVPILCQRHSTKPAYFVPGCNTKPACFVPKAEPQTSLLCARGTALNLPTLCQGTALNLPVDAEPQPCLPEAGMPRAHPVPSPLQELAAHLPLLLVLTKAKPFWCFCTWHQPLAEGSSRPAGTRVGHRHHPTNWAWASSVLINQLSVNILSV